LADQRVDLRGDLGGAFREQGLGPGEDVCGTAERRLVSRRDGDGEGGVVVEQPAITIGLSGTEVIVGQRDDLPAGSLAQRRARDRADQRLRFVQTIGENGVDEIGIEPEQAGRHGMPANLRQKLFSRTLVPGEMAAAGGKDFTQAAGQLVTGALIDVTRPRRVRAKAKEVGGLHAGAARRTRDEGRLSAGLRLQYPGLRRTELQGADLGNRAAIGVEADKMLADQLQSRRGVLAVHDPGSPSS